MTQDDQRAAVWAEIAATVEGINGLSWLQRLNRLQSGEASQVDSATIDEYVKLGICKRAGPEIWLTQFGYKCVDSAREYLWWIDRNRKLHGEGRYDHMNLEFFRGKEILEIGSGWGCNLVPIGNVARRAVGLELEPVYVELSQIFSKREEVTPPQIVIGTGDHIPFRSESFDEILMWNSLQYMDVSLVLQDCSRVLRPGGHVLLTYSSLSKFSWRLLRRAILDRDIHLFVSSLLIFLDTLSYQSFGRRIRRTSLAKSTARPIHTTRRYLLAAARKAGFFCLTKTKAGNTFWFVFRKLQSCEETAPRSASLHGNKFK